MAKYARTPEGKLVALPDTYQGEPFELPEEERDPLSVSTEGVDTAPSKPNRDLLVDDQGVVSRPSSSVLDPEAKRNLIIPTLDQDGDLVLPELAAAIVRAAEAPGRALRGELSEDQLVEEAANFAGVFTGTSAGAVRAAGGLGPGELGIVRWKNRRALQPAAQAVEKATGERGLSLIKEGDPTRTIWTVDPKEAIKQRPGWAQWWNDGPYQIGGQPITFFRGTRNRDLTAGTSASRSFNSVEEFGVHFGTKASADHFVLPGADPLHKEIFQRKLALSLDDPTIDAFKAALGTEEALSAIRAAGPLQIPLVFNGKRGILLQDAGKTWTVDEVLGQLFVHPKMQGAQKELGKLWTRLRPKKGRPEDPQVIRKEVIALLEREGFDHIVYRNIAEGVGDLSFISWKPGQLKSTTSASFSKSPHFSELDPAIVHPVARVVAGKVRGVKPVSQEDYFVFENVYDLPMNERTPSGNNLLDEYVALVQQTSAAEFPGAVRTLDPVTGKEFNALELMDQIGKEKGKKVFGGREFSQRRGYSEDDIALFDKYIETTKLLEERTLAKRANDIFGKPASELDPDDLLELRTEVVDEIAELSHQIQKGLGL